MQSIIRNAILIHAHHPKHQQKVDILIEKGVIKQIGLNLQVSNATEVKGNRLMVCAGFTDIGVEFCDPGYEQRETMQTGLDTALYGGYTRVAIHPNTQPSCDSKTGVQYILKAAETHLVQALPMGSISEGNQEKEIAELYDMQLAGAVAFSNARNPIQDTALMSRALLYAKGIQALIVHRPEDQYLAAKGLINESEHTVHLGMKGIPALAEHIMIQRDLALAEYHDTKIHFHHISTAESIAIIDKAKRKGVQVTCDVSMHHLLYNDKDLEDFEQHFKVKPPLRTARDQAALIEGLNAGIIDAITSQHSPKEIETKEVEFQLASFGNIGLQQCFVALYQHLGNKVSLEVLIKAMTSGPNAILNQPQPTFEEGSTANLVVIDLEQEWQFSTSNNQSLSYNTPFQAHTFNSKIIAVANQHQFKSLYYA